jgi:hypothetical protein
MDWYGLSRRRAGTSPRSALLALSLSTWLCIPVLRAQTDDAAQRIARDEIPNIERTVGLRFRRPPAIAVRSREQVRQYLNRKLATEYPPAELEAAQRTYRAFRLVSDTLDLRRMMLDLYSEQVAGFYDPDSSMLFVVRGADPAMLRVILAHELVHALQDQYTRLNAILKLQRQNDRQMAGQAVMEGQAMVASLSAMAPGGQAPDFSQAWGAIREGIRQQQSAMPVFAAAPRILQEGLLFPYIAGGEFIQGFDQRRLHADEMPYNERLPVSTEQILHASKYTTHETPARVIIARPPADTLVYDDDFGEFDTRVALETWGLSEGDAVTAASGWNGDRYLVLGSRSGTALVWAMAFDTPADAQEFERALRRGWESANQGRAGAAGRKWQVDALDVGGVKVVRLVDAPLAWAGWRKVPGVTVRR